jgi:predicted anti-sigma-YlaC factor YlaD
MNTHETNKARLALAEAGALTREELLEVQQHARECESCRGELERWGLYAQALRQQPQPVLPMDLVARTQARVLLAREEAADRRRSNLMFGAFAVFSWSLNFAAWYVARVVTGGVWEVLGTNLVSASSWFVMSSILACTTAAVAAVALRMERERRLS